MLYETAARSTEVLAFDIENMDRPNRRVRVRRKGGAVDVIAAPAPGTDIDRVIQRVITRSTHCSSSPAEPPTGAKRGPPGLS
jgi:hypothetical protein